MKVSTAAKEKITQKWWKKKMTNQSFSADTKKIMQPDVSKEEMEIVQDHSSKI